MENKTALQVLVSDCEQLKEGQLVGLLVSLSEFDLVALDEVLEVYNRLFGTLSTQLKWKGFEINTFKLMEKLQEHSIECSENELSLSILDLKNQLESAANDCNALILEKSLELAEYIYTLRFGEKVAAHA